VTTHVGYRASGADSLYPEVLQVEVTTRCNLRCTFCKARPDEVRARGDLPYGVYERVLEQLRGRIDRVNLWGAGEPMLHPRFFDMAQKAADLGVGRIKVSTNGHFLSPENIRKILACGITQIRIAVDVASPEEYARGRRGGDYHRVVKGIEELCSQKQKAGARIRVVVCSVLSKSGGKGESPVARMAESLGADAYEVLHDIWDESGVHTGIFPPERCVHPFKYFVLLAHGRVAPCCHVWDPGWILGDAQRQSVEEIWFGPRAKRLRTVFAVGQFPFCSRCNYWGPVELRKVERSDKDFGNTSAV